uniref:Glycine-rich cell wall structural protein-like n=1 Tax=Crassostrea virginica TaxID=6565 RepID=A0A8B8C541_CRAVI|nr:glycine-rich cell wall structural protein-like [Crassostrea virginica]
MCRIALGLLFVVLAAEASVVYRPGYKRRGRGYEPPVPDYGNGGNGYGNNGGNGGNGYGDNGGNGYGDNGGNGYGDNGYNGGNGGNGYGDNGGNGGYKGGYRPFPSYYD